MAQPTSPIPATMRAAVLTGLGGPELLRPADLPVPVPGAGEVLIRVHAAGVNAIDWATRIGQGVGIGVFPAVLGWDLSGTVAALGPGATRFAVGDQVFGMPRFPRLAGAYAQYAVAPEGELAQLPAGLEHNAAAGAPMVTLTAWESLVDHAQLTSGQRVLVSGAAGGVGHVAVQLAKALGAEVIGTASAANHEFLRELGADQVVDYGSGRVADAVKDVDVVLDPRGGADFAELAQVLRPGGIIVTLKGQQAGYQELLAARGVRGGYTYVSPNGAALGEIATLLGDGSLRIAVERVFPLAQAAEAHRTGERGHVRGRLILDTE
ncbi:NADP-dependent oxidoreductase [Kitasatospora sp. NBC_01287]|uniref:NADP-dependent oxidoreductase n=1 Tax=Kitasatospora sp. NBC_01287 TaxID=2903573 RepID=UPI0022595A95|nr:NADP-dependent oxidoreductase [Kitasatospora sp. NBC_01287]MCX4746155.1 NADP-dependent oxidoreductase [Kitasatospora sp. NBC_01287]